jgi:hypothetical protein
MGCFRRQYRGARVAVVPFDQTAPMLPPLAMRSRWALPAALAAIALVATLPSGTVSAHPPGPAAPVDLAHDMAPIDVVEVTGEAVPPVVAGGDDATAAASVEPIQPGQGFTPIFTGVPNFGGYRFQLVAGTPEVVRSWMQSVADQLTALTSVQFSVEAGTAPRWAGYAGDLFDTPASDPATWGVIRVLLFDNQSPCEGDLSPAPTGAVGCGGPDDVVHRGVQTHVRGSIWLATGLTTPFTPPDLPFETAAHEAGHVLGLSHHDPSYEGVPQLMNPFVAGVPPLGRCGTRFRSGDRNGVWYEQNRFGWIASAQYRDFLGRIPEPAGYAFWARSGVNAGQLAAALSSSPEWVGRVVDELYLRFRGAPPESAAARDFWSARVRSSGVPAVAAELFASAEYFDRNGGNIDDWIRALYRDLLGAGRAPDPDGLAFWRDVAVRSGRPAVALSIYQSLENRLYRVERLYFDLLDRAPDGGGLAFWAEQILVHGDLTLATFLASSPEYQSNADEFALAPPACTG